MVDIEMAKADAQRLYKAGKVTLNLIHLFHFSPFILHARVCDHTLINY